MTTRHLKVRNVTEALPLGAALVTAEGVYCPSRNGPTLEIPGPVTTEYTHPLERVLFDPARDANPIFHLMDALWVLAGRQDVATLAFFNKRMTEFAAPGSDSFHGAYGYRLRRHFARIDQLKEAGAMLRANPASRRVALAIWDPVTDLGTDNPDIPCNDLLVFRQDPFSTALSLHVTARSNDLIWGTYGANPVQFGTLLEYVAYRAGMPVGTLYQTSVSYHAYLSTLNPYLSRPHSRIDPYEMGLVKPFPLFPEGTDADDFDTALDAFWTVVERAIRNELATPETADFGPFRFFCSVALPMVQVYLDRARGLPWTEVVERFRILSGPDRARVDWLAATERWVLWRAGK